MTRTLQSWWNETLPMTPSRERIATELVEATTSQLERRSNLIRLDDERVIAVGGGRLVEIDVRRPSNQWSTRPSPVSYPLTAGITGLPLMLGEHGEVFAMRPDLEMKQIWKCGIRSAWPLANGAVIYQPSQRRLFGTWLVDSSGAIMWRLRSHDSISAVLDDVILAIARGVDTVCRTTATGALRWTRRGRLKVIVDDVAWLAEGTCVTAYGLERGEKRGRIDFRMLAPDLYVDPEGRGHLFGHRGNYWTIDLRSGQVLTRFKCTNPPSDLYAELPVNDGLLVRSSEHALYYLPIRDGEGALPPPLWRSDVLITRVVPHRNGLLVITNPSAPRSPILHWLAQVPTIDVP